MIKYIFGLIWLIFLVSNLDAKNKYPVNYEVIDSVYSEMSLENKIKTVLVSDKDILKRNKNKSQQGKNKALRLINMDDIYDFSGVNNPMLSDIMIRSAFLNGKNDQEIGLLAGIFQKLKIDGCFFSMKSPYSLLYHMSGSTTNDFLLEPYARIVIPFEGNGKQDYYIANTYKMPKQVLVSHEIKFNVLSQKSDFTEYEYFSTLHWHDLQKVLDEYETPPLEFILSFGGIIYSNDYEKDYQKLKRIFDKRMLPESILEKSCKKVLLYQQLSINNHVKSDFRSLEDDLKIFVNNIRRKGCVLLENKNKIIPLNTNVNNKIASIHIGVNKVSAFQKMISKYIDCDHFYTESLPDEEGLLKLKDDTENFNTIIVGVNGDWFDKDKSNKLYTFLHQVSEKAKLILVHFGSGNRLADIPRGHPFKAILLSFEGGKESQEISAEILFGGRAAQGVLAKNINGHFDFGSGYFTDKTRLGYIPSFEKAYTDSLRMIDQVVYKAIRERATPGCEVLVAKDGDVIYNKAFGYHTYSKKNHVKITDLYDIASITKIVSSVPSVMKMVDEGKMNLDDSLSYFLPRLVGTNKQGLKLRDILIHQAGLQSWIPFYMRTIDKDKLKGDIYSKRYSSQYNIKLDSRVYMNKSVRYRSDIFRHSNSGKYNVPVTDKWYMNYEYLDSIKMAIDTSVVDEDPVYRYSDLGYYYIKEIVEKVNKTTLDKYVEHNFYEPLGSRKTLYKPLRRYDDKDIIPTEEDKAWRNEIVQGYVHDPGAAMLGGVGGHAGVFSTAEDLAKILQMYLNKGSYGGIQFIQPETIEEFTSVVKEGNRRGIGFDKPVLDKDISGPSCKEASPSSFGHSGFTGTLVWVDPEYNLVYVFLSNRIHPHQYNKRLITTDVRTNIQSAIYRSLPEFWEKENKVNND